MSSRSRKAHSKSSTPISSQSASMGTPDSSRRPSSPTVLSRLQEKNELAGLNDRLALYIEKVRSLETENSRLTKIVSSQETTQTTDVSKIKAMYEDELKTARKLLDDISKEKASLQIENYNVKAELNDLKTKLNDKDGLLANKDKTILSLNSKLSDAHNQKKYWEDEYNKLKTELEALQRSMAALRKNFEDETVSRVDLENRIQSMREDAAFKARIHEQELSETYSSSRVAVEEVDTRLQDEYDSRLREALQQIREESEENIRLMRLETEAVFEKKYNELKSEAAENEGASEKTLFEIRSLRRRADEQADNINRLKDLIRGYEMKISDLEGILQREKESHQASVQALNAQIRGLNKTIEDQMLEYKDLMDMKIKLDNEIGAYRKLLELEEDRLKGAKLTFSSSRKRKRMDFDVSSSQLASKKSSTEYSAHVSSEASGLVKIKEVCLDGQFVKLTNNSSEKEVALGGWELKMIAGDAVITYKFHRNLLLKPSSTITVWSSDSSQAHNPPSDLVMKGQSWKLDDSTTCELHDQKGEQVASYLVKKGFKDDGDSISQSHNTSKGWLSFLGVML